MGTIVVIENLFEPQTATRHDWDGPYIDWLQAHYPSGFQRKHYTYFEDHLLKIENYDRVIDANDRVVLVFTPGAPLVAAAGAYLASLSIGTILATAALSAVVSLGLNFLFSKLFPTKNPGADALSASTPAAGSVYSLSIPTNRIRLGEPIPVIYGDVLWTPDICSHPYTRYASNDQYVYILLALGQGEFSHVELQIADTPVSQMSGGIIDYMVHGPAAHGQRLGAIETAWGGYFVENVDTSVEVADQELLPPQLINLSGTIQTDGSMTWATALDGAVVTGNTFSLVGTRFNNGSHSFATIAPNRLSATLDPVLAYSVTETRTTSVLVTLFAATPPDIPIRLKIAWSTQPTLGPEYLMPDGTVSSDTATITIGANVFVFAVTPTTILANAIVYDVSSMTGPAWPYADDTEGTATSAAMYFEETPKQIPFEYYPPGTEIGPFVVSRPGTLARSIELDILFPGGIYTVNETDGSLQYTTVTLSYKFDVIDDAGAVISAGTWTDYSFIGGNNTPRRETLQIGVAYGRYRASVIRKTPKSTKAADRSDAIWTGLKGMLVNDPNQVVYGDITLVSVRIKATNGLASDAANRVGVRCKRVLNGTETSNPADLLPDILTNKVYGAGRPALEVDDTANMDLRLWATGKNGFNGVFDQATNVWSALQSVLTPVQASPVTYGAQVSSVIDRVLGTYKFLFSEENIVTSSIEYGWQFVEIDGPDGFEVEYRRLSDWIADYEIYPATAINPEKVVLFGCTDAATAQAHAKYLWQRKLYRRKFCTFSTELEGHLPQLGDKIRVSHSLGGTEDYVVGSISPQDKFRFKIDAYKYAPEVFT